MFFWPGYRQTDRQTNKQTNFYFVRPSFQSREQNLVESSSVLFTSLHNRFVIPPTRRTRQTLGSVVLLDRHWCDVWNDFTHSESSDCSTPSTSKETVWVGVGMGDAKEKTPHTHTHPPTPTHPHPHPPTHTHTHPPTPHTHPSASSKIRHQVTTVVSCRAVRPIDNVSWWELYLEMKRREHREDKEREREDRNTEIW